MFLAKLRKHLALALIAAALIFSAVNFAKSFDFTAGEELRFSESESDNFQHDFRFLAPAEIAFHLQKIFFAIFCAAFSFVIFSKRKLSQLPRSPPRAS